MAQLDLSNAHISVSTSSPFDNAHLSVYGASLRDSNATVISSGSTNLIERTKNREITRFYGTFTASGTEFFLSNPPAWHVTNVSFQSGDTYDFTIGANLTCN